MQKIRSDQIKLILAQLEFTHAQLAADLGTTVTTISRWVNNKATPRGPVHKLLAPLLEQAELLRDHGYASRCPHCGRWGVQVTKRKKGDPGFDHIQERKCEYCRKTFWPPA